MPLGEDGRAMLMTSRSGTVALNPTWARAASGFTRLGIAHILTGYDHLLFLLCLVVPLRGWRQILSVITVFTVAHSFTLLGSAFNLAPSGAWFPPFVETAIAASIVYMALENIMGVNLERRVLITGLFGLVHGFGFSYGLQENFQFAGTHLLVSLFAFNVGIELGQILVLAVLLPVLALVRRYVLPGRIGMIILSAIVADTGWHWMIDRADALWKAPWPQPSVPGLAVLALWIAGILLAAGGLSVVVKRLRFASENAVRRIPRSVTPLNADNASDCRHSCRSVTPASGAKVVLAVRRHSRLLRRCGARTCTVRRSGELAHLAGSNRRWFDRRDISDALSTRRICAGRVLRG
jgi:hydrogenase/urease accessory protein HupE